MSEPLRLPEHQPEPIRERPPQTSVAIDCGADGLRYERFWESTGFSAATLTTRADMRQTLSLCRGIAHDGFRYIRPHYLLDLVVVPELGCDPADYDFSRLDAVLDEFVSRDFRLIFELMGYPAKRLGAEMDYGKKFQAASSIDPDVTCFDDLDRPEQIDAWYRLIGALARHLLDRYGAAVVRSWWFETWNEPDIGFWKWSGEAFLAYYDACSEALRAVDPELRFGGPGTARAWTDRLWELLDHCRDGRNRITGATGSRIDFIAIHSKGPADHVKFGEHQELAVRREIARRFPEFTDRPFFNDECDPVVGWSRELWWHAEAYYPAWVARSVAQGLRPEFSQDGPRYALMSSDNTFMGSWGQRVLHHRFADADGTRVSLIKKPIHNAMALIGKLDGPAILPALPAAIADTVSAVATRAPGKLTLLVSNLLKFAAEEFHNNTLSPTLSQVRRMQRSELTIRLELAGIALRDPLLVHYRIDDAAPNPFHRWQALGEPELPSAEQLAALRRDQEPLLVDEPRTVAIADRRLVLDLHLPCPCLSLIQLIERPDAAPAAPTDLVVERYTAASGGCERVLRWTGDPGCVRSWEAAWAADGGEGWEPISAAPFIDTACVHALADERSGRYRVRGRDFWGRCGPWSPELAIS